MNTKIKFGTDGFRGILGKEFTIETVTKIVNAIAEYLGQGTVIIGYDPRRDADKYAKTAANILADFGFDVILSSKVVPTPVIAYKAKTTKNCAGALMFTASHNPPEYLGIKFIPNYGGPATNEITKEIENIIESKHHKFEKLNPTVEGSVIKKDFSVDYFEILEDLIDFDAIKSNPPKIIYDALFSASFGYFDEILKRNNIDFEIYNNKYDPNFGGFLPEPKPEFMKNKKEGYITFANDGDADRYGVIDEKGDYVSPNIVLSMLLKYLKETKNYDGYMVKTVGVSQLVDVVAEKLNVKVIETPVGFKYLGEAMRMNKTILAGEDSGGLSTGDYISEKDGIYANLLILEMVSKLNKPLYRLKEEILEFAGVHFVQDRVDVKLSDDRKKEEIINEIKFLENFVNQKITKKSEIDGVKLYLEDEKTKILIRKSGTEPLLRFYIETDSNSKLNSIKEFIKGYIFILK